MNLDRIEAILRLLHRQQHVNELSVRADGWRVQAKKAPGFAPPPEPPALSPEPAAAELPLVIRAAQVGIYRSPERPLRPGDHVARGATVGQIDSMRVLNPVVAEESGYVVHVAVEDGDPVEYGQELYALTAELPREESL